MLNSVPYHVTSRRIGRSHRGTHLGSFKAKAWAMSFAHLRRLDYLPGHEIVVWYGHFVDRPLEWTKEGDIPCEGV